MALAQGYGGVGYSASEVSVDSEDFDVGALYGRIGSQINENFSAEFRVGIGVADDSVDFTGGEATLEIDKFFGGYVRGTLPLNEVIKPYVILGYTDIEVELEVDTIVGSGSDSDSDGDLSYGAGLDFHVDPNLILNLEYMNMYDDDDVEITALSFGIAAKF